jgi:large subunit ribosomal protein L19
MNAISSFGLEPGVSLPEVAPGDTVKVTSRIKEGDRERSQTLMGVVIRVRRGGAGANFTVRRVSYGIGVERTFPMHSPLLEKVELIRHGKVRRAKLYYLRHLGGKAARLKEKRLFKGEEMKEEAAEAEPIEAVPEDFEGQP